MYIAKQWKPFLLVGLFLLSGVFFAFPLLWPMGIAATVIFMSLGGITLGLAIGISIFNLYQSCFPTRKKNNQKLDEVLEKLENEQKEVEDLGVSLLKERMRFEKLKKEEQELQSELLAVQAGNVGHISSEQGGDNAGRVTEPSVSSSQSLSMVSYGPPVLSPSRNRGENVTASDIEETQKEINEKLNVLEESAAQLLQDQQAALSESKNRKNNLG